MLKSKLAAYVATAILTISLVSAVWQVSGDENPSTSPIPKAESIQAAEANPSPPTAEHTGAIVKVPLDAKIYSLQWLHHNIGNPMITIAAKTNGDNPAVKEEYAFNYSHTLRAAIVKSPEDQIQQVELELNPGSQSHAETAASNQIIIDSLQDKGYHFTLNGLIPMGQPMPTAHGFGEWNASEKSPSPWGVTSQIPTVAENRQANPFPNQMPMPAEIGNSPTQPAPTSADTTIEVPLEANSYPSDWLLHNKGNRRLTVIAEGSGITKESVGVFAIGGYFTIHSTVPESPSGGINLVRLKSISAPEPSDSNRPKNYDSTKFQQKIEELRAKKFRFLLQGLVPLGEPLPLSVTTIDAHPDYPQPTPYPRQAALPQPAITGGIIPIPTPSTSSAPLNPTAIRPLPAAASTGNFSIPQTNTMPPNPYSPPTTGPTMWQSPYQQSPNANLTPSFYPSNQPTYVDPSDANRLYKDTVGKRKVLVSPKTNPRQQLELEGARFSLGFVDSPGLLAQWCRILAIEEVERDGEPWLEVELEAGPDVSASSPTASWATEQKWLDEQFAKKKRFRLIYTGSHTTSPGPPNPYYGAITTYPAPYGPAMIQSGNTWYSPPKYAPGWQPYSSPLTPSQSETQQAFTKFQQAKTDEQRTQARKELRAVLSKTFTADMAQRDQQAKEIESRIKKLRDQYQAREQAKEEIIDLQLQLLEKQAAGLEFPARL